MAFCITLIAAQGLLKQGLQGLRPQLETHLAGVQLVDVQQVIDQCAQPFAVLVSDVQKLLQMFGHRAHDLATNQSERGRNGGQRSAQLMADGRDEVPLQALDLLALGDVVQHDHCTVLLTVRGVHRIGVGQHVAGCAIQHDGHL